MTPRRHDKSTGQWSDLETLWFGVTCWRTLAENCADSLKQGDRVVVTGRLTTRTWTNDKGEQRSGLEIDATSVGMDLSRGPVTQTRADRSAESAENEWTAPARDADALSSEVIEVPPEETAA